MNNESLFIQALKTHIRKKKYTTLGGRSFFYVQAKHEELIFTNSRNKTYSVNENLFMIVLSRYEMASNINKVKTSYYTLSLWENCPQKIVCAYLVSLIRKINK
jgi:hypothetical protein